MTPDAQYTEEYWTIAAMALHGGSFVQALARAARCADRQNRDRIRQTWPEYWERYRLLGQTMMLAERERDRNPPTSTTHPYGQDH